MKIFHSFKPLVLAATLPILAPTVAHAQSSFDSGSFGGSFGSPQPADPGTPAGGSGFGGSFDGSSDTTPAPQQPGGDDFGGSFGGSDTAQPLPTPGSDKATAPEVGGSDFGGGSFDPGFVIPEPSQDPAPGSDATQQPGRQVPQPEIGSGAGAEVLAFESRDFGVAPVATLRPGQFHAATPTAIPGGQVVSTAGLAEAINSGMQIVIIDVLGGSYSLPNAIVEPALSSPGSLSDRFQQQVVSWLTQITGGRKDIPVVVYCSDPMCWLSYNGALRVIGAGYTNVYWYRGGITAWQMAGYPVQPAAF